MQTIKTVICTIGNLGRLCDLCKIHLRRKNLEGNSYQAESEISNTTLPMNIKTRICVQKWQLEPRNVSNYYFYYEEVVPFVMKIAISCFIRTSSVQNDTLNFVDATWICENRPTSENILFLSKTMPKKFIKCCNLILQYYIYQQMVKTLLWIFLRDIRDCFVSLCSHK